MIDTAREARYTARGGREARAKPTTRPTTSHDIVGHRPTTWPQHGRPGRSARGLCAQPGSGCALGAPNPFLTQCIILSHCS